jgi:hypothetical protein
MSMELQGRKSFRMKATDLYPGTLIEVKVVIPGQAGIQEETGSPRISYGQGWSSPE